MPVGGRIRRDFEEKEEREGTISEKKGN